MSLSFPPLPPSSQKQLDRKVAELREKSHLPEAMIKVVSAVTALQLRAAPFIRLAGQEEQSLPQELLAKLAPADARAQGAFLLAREDFPLDLPLAAQLAPAILEVITAEAPELSPLANELAQKLQHGEYTLEQACRAVLFAPSNPQSLQSAEPAHPGAYFQEWQRTHPEAPGFFRFVAQSAIMPSLHCVAQLLGQRHNNEAVWPHGHCPICGSQPLIGRLADPDGARLHSCSFCAFEYRVPRIGCPFCLTSAHEGTEYYLSEDEPGYQLDVCDTCKNYFKIADFRKYDRAWLPVLDDLASLTFDLYARQMDYHRPTLSAWGF